MSQLGTVFNPTAERIVSTSANVLPSWEHIYMRCMPQKRMRGQGKAKGKKKRIESKEPSTALLGSQSEDAYASPNFFSKVVFPVLTKIFVKHSTTRMQAKERQAHPD